MGNLFVLRYIFPHVLSRKNSESETATCSLLSHKTNAINSMCIDKEKASEMNFWFECALPVPASEPDRSREGPARASRSVRRGNRAGHPRGGEPHSSLSCCSRPPLLDLLCSRSEPLPTLANAGSRGEKLFLRCSHLKQN